MMQGVARGVASSSRASSAAASPYPYCKKVFVDMPNALSRSYIQWRGKSVAASVPSDSSIPSKVRKRIPKHERRAMVESFVDKYRATNAGKFPSASLAKQQVGGSYYVIREILQELQYKSKFNPVKEVEEFPLEKVEENTFTSSDARKDPSLTETEKSGSVLLESCTYHEQSHLMPSLSEEIIKDIKVDKIPMDASKAYESPIILAHVERTCDDSSSLNADKTKGLPTVPSCGARNSDAGPVKPVSPMTNDSVKQILQGVENSGNGLSCVDNDHVSHEDGVSSDASTAHAAISSSKDSDDANLPADITIGSHSAQAESDITEDMPKSFSGERDGSRGDINGLNEAEQKETKEFLRTEDLHGGITRKLEHEEASPTKSSVWGNLKSLAHGIINFWKNM